MTPQVYFTDGTRRDVSHECLYNGKSCFVLCDEYTETWHTLDIVATGYAVYLKNNSFGVAVYDNLAIAVKFAMFLDRLELTNTLDCKLYVLNKAQHKSCVYVNYEYEVTL